MRVAVTGAGGLLGSTLVPLWREAGEEVTAWSHRDLDVTDPDAARRAFLAARPEVVIHAAAWTDVDGAEQQEDAAMRVNRDGTAVVGAACAKAGALLVYISSDYVFDGRATGPVHPDAAPNPLGAYGRSKLAGEVAARASGARWLIARTAWVYGPGGKNFVDTMRAAASERRRVRVVDDQRGAPTSAQLVAEVLRRLVRLGEGRVWHVAAAGETTWFGVARAIYAAAGAPADLVQPCSSAEAERPAARPAYGVLDVRATEVAAGPMPEWEPKVRAYVEGSVA